MRTTVTLDADTHAAIQRLMDERQVTFKDAVNQAIRAGTQTGKPKPFKTKTYDMGRPLIDLDKASQIAAQMEDEELIRKMREGR